MEISIRYLPFRRKGFGDAPARALGALLERLESIYRRLSLDSYIETGPDATLTMLFDELLSAGTLQPLAALL